MSELERQDETRTDVETQVQDENTGLDNQTSEPATDDQGSTGRSTEAQKSTEHEAHIQTKYQALVAAIKGQGLDPKAILSGEVKLPGGEEDGTAIETIRNVFREEMQHYEASRQGKLTTDQAADELKDFQKKNEIPDEVMSAVYEKNAADNEFKGLPVAKKVAVIKAQLYETVIPHIARKAATLGERKAEERNERKLTQTLPVDSEVQPGGNQLSPADQEIADMLALDETADLQRFMAGGK